jgi:enoyl-CoA hydratase
MWIYRLNLSWAKRLMLTGDAIDGKTAERIGLINKAVPPNQLEDEVQYLAQRMARIPVTQLAAMKLVINQAYENMGLHSTQLLGLILDGSMRHTPEGLDFVKTAYEKGAGVAAEERDRPFGDYRGRRWVGQPGGPPEVRTP